MVVGPGPANMVLLSVGARYGFKNSLPFLLGVIFSKQLIIWPIGLGLINLAQSAPSIIFIFKLLSILYIGWLSWKIAFAEIKPAAIQDKREIGLFSGFLIHPLNPKAWIMVTVSFSSFSAASGNILQQAALVATSFFIIQCFCHPMWLIGGSWISKIISGRPIEKIFMKVLAVLTFGSTVVLVLSN